VAPPGSLENFLRRRFSREEVVGLYFTVAVLVCLGVATLFGVLSEEVFEIRVGANSVDGVVGSFLIGLRSRRLTALVTAITQLGGWQFLTVATPLVILALWRAGHRVSALLFAGSVVGGFLLCEALKLVFGRARPALWPALVQEKTYSFPSGHSTMATVFFGGLVAVAFHLSPRRSVRLTALAFGTLCVLAVAASRVYLGAHWASDTAGGILVGLFWVVLYGAGTEYFSRRTRSRPVRN
jgi:undecaprenyl-diphosphatase